MVELSTVTIPIRTVPFLVCMWGDLWYVYVERGVPPLYTMGAPPPTWGGLMYYTIVPLVLQYYRYDGTPMYIYRGGDPPQTPMCTPKTTARE